VYFAEEELIAGVLEGCRHFGFLRDEGDRDGRRKP
jgi:hypothetical protein